MRSRAASRRAGAGSTVTTAVPLCPSVVAVIVAVPAAIARTKPVAKTSPTPASVVVHSIGRPNRALPVESVSAVLRPHRERGLPRRRQYDIAVLDWPMISLQEDRTG